MVPAGSGNGMIKSLLDPVGLPCSAKSATISIIRDVATISQGTTKFYSVLMLAWGLVADIDIESEKFRWMGGARFDIYVLKLVSRNYCDNYMRTTKYTLTTFLPKSLFEQFRRVANFYFVVVGILSFTPLAPYTAVSAIVLLTFVILATMVKEGVEDWRQKQQVL